jgi:membrane-bound lytic murein transglycosylase B
MRRARYETTSLALLMAAWLSLGCQRADAQQPGIDDILFRDFVSALRDEASAKGVSSTILDTALHGLSPDPQVVELLDRQPEHDRTAGQYVTLLVSPERLANGRARLAEHAATLAATEQRFGIDRHVVLAIWGVESNYGTSMGDRSVIRSLATLAYRDGRRPQFWRAELVAALRILEARDISAARMTGSWAGAMGHTQFMPSTYIRHAADADGDGKRDIWSNIADALGSTASYLKASGWTTGQPWGFEVIPPPGFDFALSGPGKARRGGDWQALGLSTPSGHPWPVTAGDLTLIVPSGATGPAFLTTTNFRAILRYNASTAYALAVSLLADSIAADALPQVRWPENERALTRPEREELQRLLTDLGHDTGTPDGIVGTQTRNAIRAFQRTWSLAEDGHPSHDLLARLRAARP